MVDTNKKTYPALKMPSPRFNMQRLEEGKSTGLLSRHERQERVGKEQILVNELNKAGDRPFAYGIIKIGKGQRLAGIGAVSKEVAKGLDEFTLREFQLEKIFWYHPFEKVRVFDTPVELKKPVVGRRFASDINLEQARVKETKDAFSEKLPPELKKFAIDPDGNVHAVDDGFTVSPSGEVSIEYVLILPGMIKKWLTFAIESPIEKEALDESVDIVRDRRVGSGFFCKCIGQLESGDPVYEAQAQLKSNQRVISEVEEVITASPDDLRSIDNDHLKRFYLVLHGFHQQHFAGNKAVTIGGISREDIVNAYLFVLDEMKDRGSLPKPKDELDSEAIDLVPGLFKDSEKRCGPKKDRKLAETHPSGKKMGRRITLKEVVEKIRPFRFRQDAVTLVGGLPNHGFTDNDIDILIKGPLDEQTRHVLEFRIGRMLGPELSERIQFLDDDLGGPFTNHISLGNLLFETNEEFDVKEMRDVEKQDDPLQSLPPKGSGKRQAVFQAHFRGKSVHGDLRFDIGDQLVGWTIAIQKPGTIKEPVETVSEGKQIVRGYEPEEGNKFLKPFIVPHGLFATPKPRQPKVWLGIGDEVFEAGEVGATRNFPAVWVFVDKPKIEFGRQSPRFHEYFVTDSKLMPGVLVFRQLVSGGDEDGGTPKGDVFWRMFLSKNHLPSILKRRTVKEGAMPPDGYSWIPKSLEQDVPEEFRYWKKKGTEARKVRDALVDEKIFTESSVQLVNGEFRLVLKKFFLGTEEPEEVTIDKELQTAKYTLSRQTFRGPVQVRAGFSKAFWWFILDTPKESGVRAWKLQTNPSSGEERITAIKPKSSLTNDKELMIISGEIEPKSRFNETKATPSRIDIVGRGEVDLLDEQSDLLKLRFKNGPLKGVKILEAEEEGSEIWEFSDSTASSEPSNKIRGEGIGVGNPSLQDGGTDYCKCPKCGFRIPHDRGEPCVERFCPQCGNSMVGETVKVAAEVPTKDGIQIWDLAHKSTKLDRTQLEPFAIYTPMKSVEGFFDPDKMIDDWAKPEILKNGLYVEPKFNGLRTSIQAKDGKSLVFFEDSKTDRSKILPGVATEAIELEKKIGPFILDAEIVDHDEQGNVMPRRTLSRFTGPVKPQDDSNVKMLVFHGLYLDDKNMTAVPYDEMREKLSSVFQKMGETKHFEQTESRLVETENELADAIEWASKIPGSEGAMLKMKESTYSLGGKTDSWTKLKLTRIVRAIVSERILKKPSPQQKAPSQTWVYRCAVGPIPKKDVDAIDNLVKISGEWYSLIGKTFATNVKANQGDVLEVQFTELLVDETGEKETVHWFTPVVIERVEGKPNSFESVTAKAFEHEIKKFVDKFITKRLPIIKGESKEERIVYGVVLEPEIIDKQDDIYSEEEVRSCAHRFMEEFQHLGLMHRKRLDGRLKVLETYISPQDMIINEHKIGKGTWLMVIRVLDDQVWEDVKSGNLTGLSIGGSAVRTPEMPPVTE